MPKYLIEREIANAAALSADELRDVARRSNAVLRDLGPSIQWVQSYVTEDKITCVYIAPNAELVREHARLGGFPADRVLEIASKGPLSRQQLEIASVIDPTTAEAAAPA